MKLSQNPVVLMIVIFITTIILVNIFVPDPVLRTPQEMISYGKETNNNSLVYDGACKRLSSDSSNIDFNYEWVLAQYNYDRVRFRRGPFMEDLSVVQTYAENARFSDLNAYCAGLYYLLFDDYDRSFEYLSMVKNPKLKYLNNSMGVYLIDRGKDSEAEKAFKREIENKGYLKGAYVNLFNLYLRTKQYDKIKILLSNDDVYKYLDNKKLSEFFFLTNDPLGYAVTILKKIVYDSNIYGWFAALLILLSWVIFLRNVDVFSPEKWQYILVAVGAGAVCSLFAFPLYDFDTLKLGFDLNGGTTNDFLYSIFGIGAIEELVKILPVILLARFTGLIKEPIDYVIYACLSALGFAFVENLLYFDSTHLYIIHGRAMLTAVGHMFNSAIIGYGMAQQKLFHKINKYLNFLLFYLLASLSHGLYDFMIFQMNAGGGIFLFFLFFFLIYITVSTLNNFINNTLNLSSYLKESDSINLRRLQDLLVCSLSAVVLYEYMVLAVKFGSSYADTQLVRVSFSNIFFIIFLGSNLSSIDLNKGMWDNPLFPKFSRRPGLSFIINKSITIFPKPTLNVLSTILPLKGVVVKRILIGDQSDYLIVKLDVPLNVSLFTQRFNNIPTPNPDYILIKGTDRKRTLTLGYKQPVYFVTLSATLDPFNDKLAKKDINFIEYAFIG